MPSSNDERRYSEDEFALVLRMASVVPAGELGRVIDVARRALSTQGETREVLGALEWKGGTSMASFGETDAGLIASVLSSLPPSFLIARTLWKRSTKKYRECLLHLMDEAVVEEVADSENGQGLGEAP